MTHSRIDVHQHLVEIAAVANYVSARFGAQRSAIRPEDVAKLRGAS